MAKVKFADRPLTEWARDLGIKYSLLWRWMNRGNKMEVTDLDRIRRRLPGIDVLDFVVTCGQTWKALKGGKPAPQPPKKWRA